MPFKNRLPLGYLIKKPKFQVIYVKNNLSLTSVKNNFTLKYIKLTFEIELNINSHSKNLKSILNLSC